MPVSRGSRLNAAFTRVPRPTDGYQTFHFLSRHNSLKTDRREALTVPFVDLVEFTVVNNKAEGSDMHCLALQESLMNMCRVQLWFGCTLRRWFSADASFKWIST